MVAASLIATTATWDKCNDDVPSPEEGDMAEAYDSMDGLSEEEAYLQGMSSFAAIYFSLILFQENIRPFCSSSACSRTANLRNVLLIKPLTSCKMSRTCAKPSMSMCRCARS